MKTPTVNIDIKLTFFQRLRLLFGTRIEFSPTIRKVGPIDVIYNIIIKAKL